MLKFLWHNIKHSIMKQRLMTVLLVAVQLFSVMVIAFSYGLINHYNFKIDEKESTALIYDFLTESRGPADFDFVYPEQIDGFMKNILPYVEKKLDYFFIMGHTGEKGIQCSSGYEKGMFKLSAQLERRIGVKKGEKFTDAQMNSNEKIMIAREPDVDSDWCMQIGEDKYKAVGLLSKEYMDNYIFVPYKAMPNNTKIYYISLLFKEPLFESEYNEIVSMFKGAFGDLFNIPEFEGIDNESSNRVYKDIMFVTVFLIIVCVVNYCIMYKYLLDKRRREFAITRICGCTKYKAGIVYMIELIGVSAITLVAGLLMYHYWILPKAIEQFNYIGLFYSSRVYLTISCIYMGTLSLAYLVLVCKFIRKTPVALMKEV